MIHQVNMIFFDSMRAKINSGIMAGLDEAKAGRSHEITDDYVTKLKQRLKKRLSDNSLPRILKS